LIQKDKLLLTLMAKSNLSFFYNSINKESLLHKKCKTSLNCGVNLKGELK